jgi:hypothetical protein
MTRAVKKRDGYGTGELLKTHVWDWGAEPGHSQSKSKRNTIRKKGKTCPA